MQPLCTLQSAWSQPSLPLLTKPNKPFLPTVSLQTLRPTPARGHLCSSGQRSLPSSPAGLQAAPGRSCDLALPPLPSPYLDPQGTRSHLRSAKSLTLLMNAFQTLVPTTSSWPSPILKGGTVILRQVRTYRPCKQSRPRGGKVSPPGSPKVPASQEWRAGQGLQSWEGLWNQVSFPIPALNTPSGAVAGRACQL